MNEGVMEGVRTAPPPASRLFTEFSLRTGHCCTNLANTRFFTIPKVYLHGSPGLLTPYIDTRQDRGQDTRQNVVYNTHLGHGRPWPARGWPPRRFVRAAGCSTGCALAMALRAPGTDEPMETRLERRGWHRQTRHRREIHRRPKYTHTRYSPFVL